MARTPRIPRLYAELLLKIYENRGEMTISLRKVLTGAIKERNKRDLNGVELTESESAKLKRDAEVVSRSIERINALSDFISIIRQAKITRELPIPKLWQVFGKIVKDLLFRLGLSTLKLEDFPLEGPEWVDFEFYVDPLGFYGEHDGIRCNIRENGGSLCIDLDPLYKGAGEYNLDNLQLQRIKAIMRATISNLTKAYLVAAKEGREEQQELRIAVEILPVIIAEI